jgi:uncharacterized protein YhhL (DUF1145 family)
MKGNTMPFAQELSIAVSASATLMLAYALVLAIIDQRPKKDPHKR